jgi:hypothetical protein
MSESQISPIKIQSDRETGNSNSSTEKGAPKSKLLSITSESEKLNFTEKLSIQTLYRWKLRTDKVTQTSVNGKNIMRTLLKFLDLSDILVISQ